MGSGLPRILFLQGRNQVTGEAQKEENAACLNLIMERTRRSVRQNRILSTVYSIGKIGRADCQGRRDSAEFDADLILQNNMEVHMAGIRRIPQNTNAAGCSHPSGIGLVKNEDNEERIRLRSAAHGRKAFPKVSCWVAVFREQSL